MSKPYVDTYRGQMLKQFQKDHEDIHNHQITVKIEQYKGDSFNLTYF